MAGEHLVTGLICGGIRGERWFAGWLEGPGFQVAGHGVEAASGMGLTPPPTWLGRESRVSIAALWWNAGFRQ